jgi:pyruvate,water dikinase
VDLDLDSVLAEGSVDDVVADLRTSPEGEKWLAAWDQAKQPWFNFSAGSGFYHTDKVWLENLDIPLGFVRNYIAQVRRGEQLDRPLAEVSAERDRIVSEYTELIEADEDRAAFEAKLGLARVVFPYVENHNFYIEHWAHSIIWRKMRDLGGVLAGAGFFSTADDIFLLKRTEVIEAIFDLYHGWAVGIPSRGPAYWSQEIKRREGVMDALRQWSPPPALGVPPEVITEPFTIMLWGITSDSVKQWLGGAQQDGGLTGFAASPGVAEGPARVITSADGIADLQEGEILVAPLTAPSWAPVFGKIAATVTDVGGIMSHAAIVCREYGLPAVTGTAFGTKTIKTGQRLRVDGNTGQVTVLD